MYRYIYICYICVLNSVDMELLTRRMALVGHTLAEN